MMTDLITVSKSMEEPPLAPEPKYWRYLRYLTFGLITNAAIWGAAAIYLKVAPITYVSNWALILPGASAGVNVNLPEIGQATSSSSSPFGSTTMDPRANYQFIATDEAVLGEAASRLQISLEDIDKPKVKLVDNTSIMQFEVTGTSPTDAQRRSKAIYTALQNRLSRLRLEEIAKREQASQGTLKSAQEKLQIAQKRLSAYKASSGLSSNDQIRDLTSSIEQLRKQKAESSANVAQTTNRLSQLSSDLNLTVPEAANAFLINADRLFQQNLKDYNEASAAIDVSKAKWGNNHPSVVKELGKQKTAGAAALARAKKLLGRTVSEATLNRLSIRSETGSSRESLLRDLVAVQSEQKGTLAHNLELSGQIVSLEARLKTLVQKQTTLDSLQRQVQIAEAVFASTLTKLDLGKSDMFTSYPIAQLLTEPSLPDTARSPKPLYVYLGAGIGSLSITTGLILLWWRKEKKLLTRSQIVEVSKTSESFTLKS